MCRADRIPLAAQLSVAARRVASHRVASGPSLRQGYLRVSTGRRNPRYKSALLKLRCICFWTDVEKRRASSRDCRLSVCTIQISRAARSQALCPFAHIHVSLFSYIYAQWLNSLPAFDSIQEYSPLKCATNFRLPTIVHSCIHKCTIASVPIQRTSTDTTFKESCAALSARPLLYSALHLHLQSKSS